MCTASAARRVPGSTVAHWRVFDIAAIRRLPRVDWQAVWPLASRCLVHYSRFTVSTVVTVVTVFTFTVFTARRHCLLHCPFHHLSKTVNLKLTDCGNVGNPPRCDRTAGPPEAIQEWRRDEPRMYSVQMGQGSSIYSMYARCRVQRTAVAVRAVESRVFRQ